MPSEPKPPRPLDANNDPIFTKEELAKIHAAELADVLPDWPFSKKNLNEINGEMAESCMTEIGRILALGECMHGKDHGATPGMMYPEWIICIMHKVRQEALDQAIAHLEASRTVARSGMSAEALIMQMQGNITTMKTWPPFKKDDPQVKPV